MAYIGRLRITHPWSLTIPLAAIFASHDLRGEQPAKIGVRTGGFSLCLRRYGPALAAIVAIGLACALEWGALRSVTARSAALSFSLYLPWGYFQQYLLNGYLLNRLDTTLSPAKSAATASSLFALAHLPNWFLMAATPVFGCAANVVYRRHRNLYFLGLAHALLGFTIFIAAPDSLIHRLRIGPGWFRH